MLTERKNTSNDNDIMYILCWWYWTRLHRREKGVARRPDLVYISGWRWFRTFRQHFQRCVVCERHQQMDKMQFSVFCKLINYDLNWDLGRRNMDSVWAAGMLVNGTRLFWFCAVSVHLNCTNYKVWFYKRIFSFCMLWKHFNEHRSCE